MKKRLQVACGIIEKDGRYLIVKRGQTSKCALKWEFPGGKIEKGETLEECMTRELKEELDIEVEVHQRLDTVVRENEELTTELIPFRCKIIKGEIQYLVIYNQINPNLVPLKLMFIKEDYHNQLL